MRRATEATPKRTHSAFDDISDTAARAAAPDARTSGGTPLRTGRCWHRVAALLFTLPLGCHDPASPPPQTPAGAGAEPTQASTGDDSLQARLAATGPNADAERATAVQEAIAIYDQAARNGTTSDEARAFVRQYGAPLTRVASEHLEALSPKLRVALINLLVSFDDPVTSPAFAAALAAYAKTGQDVECAIWATRGATEHPSAEIASALLADFRALDMSTKDGRRFSAHLSSALVANARPEWIPFLVETLNPTIDRPARFDDKPAAKAYHNQVYWQSMAAQLLGQLHATDEVRTLTLVLLDPKKREVHAFAEQGLSQLGSAVTSVAEGLLTGGDGELVDRARIALGEKQVLSGQTHTGVAASPIAATPRAKPTRPEPMPNAAEASVYYGTRLVDLTSPANAAQALRGAWEKTQHPGSRTLIVRSLCRLPNANCAELLQTTFASTPISTTLPDGESAQEELVGAAVTSLDHAALVPWLTSRVDKVTGAAARRGDVQRALVEAIATLAFPDDIKRARTVAQRFGGRTGTPAFELSASLLARCGAELECYRQQLNSTEGEPFLRVKAAAMLAILGDAKVRPQLSALLRTPLDRDLLRLSLIGVEHLTPSQDAAALDELSAALSNGTLPEAQRVAIERTRYRLAAR